ncbi:unnamed protein product [Closterium sp. Naga37s-1]|nr:unnamed protein product [Closterium sp. Naga37s-1]
MNSHPERERILKDKFGERRGNLFTQVKTWAHGPGGFVRESKIPMMAAENMAPVQRRNVQQWHLFYFDAVYGSKWHCDPDTGRPFANKAFDMALCKGLGGRRCKTMFAKIPVVATICHVVEWPMANAGSRDTPALDGSDSNNRREVQLKVGVIIDWIKDRELQLMWRDDTGAQHSAFLKARDGKEQGRGATGFIQRMVIDGRDVIPPFHPGSSISADGGFKLLLAESRSQPGRIEDEFHLKIEGVVDLSLTARVAHPLMQTATEAQAHFNVHIVQLNHTEGIHGVLGQTFRGEASRAVRSLRHRLLTRLLREPVDVESSEGGDGLLDGRVQDYLTSGIAAPDCAFAAAWRRGEHESEMGDDGVDSM